METEGKALKQPCGERVMRCDSSDGQNCIAYFQIMSAHEPASYRKIALTPEASYKGTGNSSIHP